MTLKKINELIIDQEIDWKGLASSAQESFSNGILELIEEGELTESKEDYKIELERMSLNFLDSQLGIPNLSFNYSIYFEEEVIGYYQSIWDLDFKELDDFLVLY